MNKCKHTRYVEDVHEYCPDCGEDKPSVSHRYEARIKELEAVAEAAEKIARWAPNNKELILALRAAGYLGGGE